MRDRGNDLREAIGDAQYEAYRRGLNPDRVDYDRVCQHVYEGMRPDEAASAEADYLAAEEQRRREAEERFYSRDDSDQE